MTTTTDLTPALRGQLQRCVRAARPLAEAATGGDAAAAFDLWHGVLLARFHAARGLPLPPAARPGAPRLEALLASLDPATFAAADALGWTWQFWRAAGTRAARSGRIGNEDVAGMTQLFTEPYMVRFLLHNTLGAWHAARTLARRPELARASDEAGARAACALPGIDWTLLRLVREDGAWRPAAGAYAGWPWRAADLTLLDPCCGGGHFLVAALPMLAALRAAEEGLEPAASVRAVLRDNLCGLDLDGRCVQVAKDALTLAARSLAGAAASLPCPGIEWVDLPPLGSLTEAEAVPQGAEAVRALLARRYTLLATNVPFLGWRRLPAALAEHVARRFPMAKADLATVMLERMRALAAPGGTVAAVTPQNWLFLGSWRAMRRAWLREMRVNLLAVLGEHGFASTGAAGAFAALVVMTRTPPEPEARFAALDAHAAAMPADKAALLATGPLLLLRQAERRTDADARLVVEPPPAAPPPGARVGSFVGFQNGDTSRWVRKFWEQPGIGPRWSLLQRPVDVTVPYGGCDSILLWEQGGGALAASDGVFVKGREAWGRPGVLVRQFRQLPCTLYGGELFDQSGAVLCPADPADLPALWAFCASPEYARAVRRIDRKVNVTNGTLAKVGFDLARWRGAAMSLPEPYSDDPTQWLFHGHPARAAPGTGLHVALARVAGYRWPAETGVAMRLSAAARALLAETARLPPGADGAVLPLHAQDGTAPLAARLRQMLAAAYGAAWSHRLETDLVRAADMTFDKRVARDLSLQAWLSERAFRQHAALFRQRPFLWQIGEKRPGGLRFFLNYHRLSAAALRDLADAVPPGALRDGLRAILLGEPPCDIFVRWKGLAAQPLGWNPDPDDGVRQNIRPFIMAGVLTLDLSKLLKATDRGANGQRRNDRHTTLAEKGKARGFAPFARG
jgi:hypothetical protein